MFVVLTSILLTHIYYNILSPLSIGLGYYMYYEASGPNIGHTASLKIPASLIQSQEYCLQFAYHMYGSNMGSLSVGYSSRNGNQTIWSRSGNLGNRWQRAAITFRLFQPTSNVSTNVDLDLERAATSTKES